MAGCAARLGRPFSNPHATAENHRLGIEKQGLSLRRRPPPARTGAPSGCAPGREARARAPGCTNRVPSLHSRLPSRLRGSGARYDGARLPPAPIRIQPLIPAEDLPLAPLRLVLDTNVALDLVFWRDPAVAGLEAAVAAGAVRLLSNARCLGELRHVLQRPPFDRHADPEALFERFSALCEVVAPAVPDAEPALPRCKDPADQKFLELARAARADLLVTKDKALLTLARKKHRLAGFRIVSPKALAPLLHG